MDQPPVIQTTPEAGVAATAAQAASMAASTAANVARDVASKASEDMGTVSRLLQEHTNSDEIHFLQISNSITNIKDNHLFHIEKDVAKITASVESLHGKLDANTKETVENKSSIGWIVKIGGAAWAVALILFSAMVYIVRDAITK